MKTLADIRRFSEKYIERKLREEVEKRGGICLKFQSMTDTGYPDRIILLPLGMISFVELKTRGKKPTKLQMMRHTQLRKMGFPVFVIDDSENIINILNEIQAV